MFWRWIDLQAQLLWSKEHQGECYAIQKYGQRIQHASLAKISQIWYFPNMFQFGRKQQN